MKYRKENNIFIKNICSGLNETFILYVVDATFSLNNFINFNVNKMENKEIWKDIPGYEGYYQVSNLGNVRSLDRNVLRKNGFIHKLKSSPIKSGKNSRGYLLVVLSKYGIPKSIQVHQLVCMAFLDYKPYGLILVVDHINNIKTDNRLCNLQIITRRENSSKNNKQKTSSYIGVSFYKQSNKWESKILFDGKQRRLGYFDSEEDAAMAYKKKLAEINNY